LSVERAGSLDGFITYFELVLSGAVDARIGIALSRDPEGESPACLVLESIADVDIEVAFQIECVPMTASALAGLGIGSFVPISPTMGTRGSLRVGGRTLAHGRCGVIGGRFACAIDDRQPEDGERKSA
jgi:flagellar motor switch protein FliM